MLNSLSASSPSISATSPRLNTSSLNLQLFASSRFYFVLGQVTDVFFIALDSLRVELGEALCLGLPAIWPLGNVGRDRISSAGHSEVPPDAFEFRRVGGSFDALWSKALHNVRAKSDHLCIRPMRSSRKRVRRYAALTAFGSACASAASDTSSRTAFSAAQSLKALRKPCGVPGIPASRMSFDSVLSDRTCCLVPGNTIAP